LAILVEVEPSGECLECTAVETAFHLRTGRHSITLTPRNWAMVKSGKELYIRGEGYNYEGEFFWEYWHFKGGLEGNLYVTHKP
jgi:hypothetical protein